LSSAKAPLAASYNAGRLLRGAPTGRSGAVGLLRTSALQRLRPRRGAGLAVKPRDPRARSSASTAQSRGAIVPVAEQSDIAELKDLKRP
jgi:hypothetical protein